MIPPFQVPVGLLERVAHYATPSPPTHARHAHGHAHPSPPIKGLRMRLRNVVVPSPSSTISTKSSEGATVATPAALQGGVSSKVSARAAEARKLREDALRLQEEQEEKELKLRRKVSGRGQVKWVWQNGRSHERSCHPKKESCSLGSKATIISR